MKKRILSIGSLLMLTATMFYFSGCKKAVKTLLDVDCFICTHPTDSSLDEDDVCNTAALNLTDALKALGYTCTSK